MSIMDSAPSSSDFFWPMGLRMAVIFAGQGVMKKQPTSEGLQPFFLQNSARATEAATSMGWRMSTMFSISSGKRTWISRTTVGQAEEIRGFGSLGSFIFSRMARVTMSAPRATSNTSSKPIFLSASSTNSGRGRSLNWP